MEEEKKDNRGKKFHQKIKPYVVLQYLLKYTDETIICWPTMKRRRTCEPTALTA